MGAGNGEEGGGAHVCLHMNKRWKCMLLTKCLDGIRFCYSVLLPLDALPTHSCHSRTRTSPWQAFGAHQHPSRFPVSSSRRATRRWPSSVSRRYVSYFLHARSRSPPQSRFTLNGFAHADCRNRHPPIVIARPMYTSQSCTISPPFRRMRTTVGGSLPLTCGLH